MLTFKNKIITAIPLLCVLSMMGCSESSDKDDTDDTDTDVSSTNDASLNAAWKISTATSDNLKDEDSGDALAMDIQSVEQETVNGINYTVVSASGVPSYDVTITQTYLDILAARPNASTDFADGVAATIGVGEVISFGDDIGYSTNIPICDSTGGGGYWPPGLQCPQDKEKTIYLTHEPTATSDDCETATGAIGVFLNGASIFDWQDDNSYNSEGVWQNIAAVHEVYDLDMCYGHSADNEYHHHNWSSCLAGDIGDAGDAHSPVYGYASDGYPVHGPWYADGVLAVSAWVARDYDDVNKGGCGDGLRTCLLNDQYDLDAGTTAASSDGPDPTGTVTTQSGNVIDAVSGAYFQDYYYDSSITALGDKYLDEHGGHDHDGLGYHYHMPATDTDNDNNLEPVFPYTFGPTYYGELDDEAASSCGGSGSGTPSGPPPGM